MLYIGLSGKCINEHQGKRVDDDYNYNGDYDNEDNDDNDDNYDNDDDDDDDDDTLCFKWLNSRVHERVRRCLTR